MTPELQTLLGLVQQVGMWAIFAWLYVDEKRAHKETLRSKDAEIERLRSAHLADIREIAGMRQALYQVGSPMHPAVPRDRSEVRYTPDLVRPPGPGEVRGFAPREMIDQPGGD